MKLLTVTLLFCFLAGIPPASIADEAPMTRSQGEAILKELRAIRSLLEKQKPQKNTLKPQVPQYLDIDLSGRSFLGNAEAPLVIVEFTDYQCPFCKRFHDETFGKLKKEYIDSGKLRFISMDLPLDFHSNANNAALAAKCADDQQKFWELRELMINNSRNLALSDIEGYAEEAALDMVIFKSCMASKKHQPAIDADKAYAKSVGITGTPTFIIAADTSGEKVRGRKLVGAQPYSSFVGVMKTELNKAKQRAQKQ